MALCRRVKEEVRGDKMKKIFDLKGLYQEKAEELSGDADYYTLPEEEQLRLYNQAIELVNERLQAPVDDFLDDINTEEENG